MANLGQTSGRASGGQLAPPVGQVIARYATYGEAQRAVDFLSDNRFPVQAVTIVGTDLRSVERVTGRLTYGRVALAGALSGAWFGLFVGLLLSLFAQGPDAGVPAAVLIGAGFGMLFGVITYAAARGRRDFTSQSAIIANEYQVLCRDEQARAAIEVLGRLPHANRAGAPPAPVVPNAPVEPPVRSGPPPVGQPVPPGQPGPYNPYAPPPHGPYAGTSTELRGDRQSATTPVDTLEGPGTAAGDTSSSTADHADPSRPPTPVPPNPVPPGSGPSTSGPYPAGNPLTTAPGWTEPEPVTPPEPPAPPAPTGPTYGEVMAQRRREQREREAAERAERIRRATEGDGE